MASAALRSSALSLALLALSQVHAGTEPKCTSVFGTQRDSLVTTGCASPVGFCTAGTVSGNHGLRGTSTFSALAFDPIASDPLGRIAAPGTTTYTTDDGTLVVQEVSAFDVQAGTLAGIGRIVEGTGAYLGATGDLFSTRRVSADGKTITGDLTGEICLP
jgi:hypothetical protein